MYKYRITFLLVILSLLFFSFSFAQRASVEELATMPTPTNEDGTRAGDGNRKVIQNGNTLYVLNYWIGLQTIDITNSKKPKELSVFRTSSRNFNFLLDGNNHILIASEESGVYIIDVTNPSKLKMTGRVRTANDAIAIALDGNTLAVAQGDQPIEIFDISNINKPQKLGDIPVKTWVWSLAFVSGKLYAGSKDCCLFVYDISTPANPQILDHVNINQVIKTIRVEKNYIYIAAGPGGVIVFDVSNPDKPEFVSQFQTGGYVYDIFKSGEFVFAANEKLKALQIISFEDKKNPQLVYTKEFPSKVYGVTKESGSVYIAADVETFSMRYNNAPRIDPIADQKVDENSTLVVKAKGSDPDYDEVYFTMENLPEGAKFDSVDTFTWTPNYEQSGIYKGITFRITEKTESHLSSVAQFSIFVNHVNRPPVLAKVDSKTIDENQTLEMYIPQGSDPDIEDKGLLRYFIENIPENATFDTLTLQFKWTPTYDQSGVYDLVAVLRDPSGLEARSPFQITVNHVDRPPVVEKVAPEFTVDENKLLSITFKGSDPDIEDKDIYLWSAKNLPEGAQFDPKTQTFTWTPTYEQSGLYKDVTVYLKTNDKADSTTFAIKVNHVNRSPVLNDIANYTVKENDSLKFTINGSDPDKEDQGKLVYSATDLPEGAIFDKARMEFEWLPTYEQSGTYTIEFHLTDPSGLVSTKKSVITVEHVNRPPKLDTLATQKVDENALLQFTVKGFDPDKEDQANLRITAANLPKGAQFNEQTNQFTWTPNYEQSGQYKVDFTIDDGAGAKDNTSVDIVVNHVNRPPVLEQIAAQTVDENKLLTFVIKGSDPDKEDQANLKITATELPQGARFDDATSTFSWTPAYDQSGKYKATFKIDDGAGLSNTMSVDITVNNINRTPVWDYTVQAATDDENKPFTLTLEAAHDPDKENKDNLQYSAKNMPQGGNFNPQTRTFTWTPNFDQSGKYKVEFDVTDGEFVLSKTLDLTVNNVNRSPELSLESTYTGQEDQELDIKIGFSDPDKEDNGKISLTVEDLPKNAKFDSKSGEISWTPGYDQSGTYQLKAVVKDPAGLSVEKSFTVEIKDKNRNPELSVPSVSDIKEGDDFNLTVTAKDPDNDDLTFSLNGDVPSGMTIDPKGGAISWTGATPGSYTFNVVVKDTKGGEDSDSVTLQVEAKPKPENAPDQPNPAQ